MNYVQMYLFLKKIRRLFNKIYYLCCIMNFILKHLLRVIVISFFMLPRGMDGIAFGFDSEDFPNPKSADIQIRIASLSVENHAVIYGESYSSNSSNNTNPGRRVPVSGGGFESYPGSVSKYMSSAIPEESSVDGNKIRVLLKPNSDYYIFALRRIRI